MDVACRASTKVHDSVTLVLLDPVTHDAGAAGRGAAAARRGGGRRAPGGGGRVPGRRGSSSREVQRRQAAPPPGQPQGEFRHRGGELCPKCEKK